MKKKEKSKSSEMEDRPNCKTTCSAPVAVAGNLEGEI
jgi:hypothetical protein